MESIKGLLDWALQDYVRLFILLHYISFNVSDLYFIEQLPDDLLVDGHRPIGHHHGGLKPCLGVQPPLSQLPNSLVQVVGNLDHPLHIVHMHSTNSQSIF